MGVLGPVFRTFDPERDRLVAVKVFRLDTPPEQAVALAEQLNRMAELGLTDPGLVAPLAAGVADTVAYLALEYVVAESLDVAMRHYAPATLDRALPFVTQLARALDGARAAGVLHGSLHPRDVFVTPDSARTTGIGIVSALEQIGLRGPVRRPYTAPERIAGEEWGAPADVFSLAAIAFELIAGKRVTGTGAEAAAALGERSTGVDTAAVERLFASALAEDAGQRPATAQAFAAGLESLTGTSAASSSVTVPALPADAADAEAVAVEPVEAPGTRVDADAARPTPVETRPADAADAALGGRETVPPPGELQVETGDDTVEEAAEPWDVESQEPVTWDLDATDKQAEHDEPSEVDVPPSPAGAGRAREVELPPEAREAHDAAGVAPGIEPPTDEAAVTTAAPDLDREIDGREAEDEPAPGVVAEADDSAPALQESPSRESTEDDSAWNEDNREDETDSELAAWIASVELTGERTSLRLPEMAEIEHILTAPEASEPEEAGRGVREQPEPVQLPQVEAVSPAPEASLPEWPPPASIPTEAIPVEPPRRTLFDTGPPAEPETPHEVAAASPALPVAEQPEPITIQPSESAMWNDEEPPEHPAESPNAPVESSAESSGVLMGPARESKRSPMLPIALSLVVGMLVAFVAGFGLGSRQPASAPAEAPAAESPGPAADVDAGPPPAAVVVESGPAPVEPAASPTEPAEAPPPPVPAEPAPDVAAAQTETEAVVEEPVEPAPTPTPRPPAIAEVAQPPEPAPAAAPAGAPADQGRLLVRTTPPGAQVAVNGAASGITPLALSDLPYGDYAVRISRAGYEPELASLTLSADQPMAVLAVDLQEAGTAVAQEAGTVVAAAPPVVSGSPGTLVIDSRPAGADIYLDDQLVASTPATLLDVAPGPHAVRIVRDGYREWTTTVEVTEGQELRMAASLEGLPR